MGSGQVQGHGLRVPGRVVMLLQQGSGWVMRQDGTREEIAAENVVIWDDGEWMEYGSDGSSEFKAEFYWAAVLSEEAWAARMSEIFG